MTAPNYRHLEAHPEGDVLVVTFTDAQLRGDELASRLREELLEAVGDAGKVVVDMHHVQYMSSVAFRPLLALYQHLKERQGRVVLCGLSRPVAEVLHLTRLISTSHSSQAPFQEKPDVAAAVASLGGAAT